ncbi:MAG: histidinol dehydrogenase [Candidatus Lokiarchaeota archaeon]|nr:histidinol dehydrogenase [Candidatus Lokiarchaeota archaeon]
MDITIKKSSSFSPAELRKATVDQARLGQVMESVAEIIRDVRQRGDAAVLDYTRKFDGVEFNAGDIKVPQGEIDSAYQNAEVGIISALETARDNIWKYHEKQKPAEWEIETTRGVRPGLIIRPLDTVGVYVPGGKAFYPSTVLMTVVPAVVAGVKRIVMVTPPKKDGKIEPIVLASAKVAGVSEIYKVGGAQAIAALAVGTQTIPKVDAVVGPGNVYVTAAKQLLQGEVLIDSPAGPSEVLIIAGEAASPRHVALDMCAQAEHDQDAVAIVAVTSDSQAKEVVDEINDLLPSLVRKAILEASLSRNGLIVVIGKTTKDAGYTAEAARIINGIAPEHLQLSLDEEAIAKLLPLVKNSGAIFLGEDSPVPLGDYAAGTNHVLPTNGTAARYSALNTTCFVKYIPVTRASKEGLRNLAPTVSKLARFEKLDAHARAVEDRVKE